MSAGIKVQRRAVARAQIRPKSREQETGAVATEEEPELSPTEKAVLQKLLDHRSRHPAPSMKVTKKNGEPYILPDHPSEAIGTILLMDAVGTASSPFFDGLLRQLTNVGCPGQEVTESGLNFVLSIVKGIGPRDETEAMLAAQMAAIHNATMTAARRLAHVDNIPQQDSASNMLNKLARTYAAQVEALKKYRSSGEQTIKVQHVTVNQGGQAIVGNVEARGEGVRIKSEEQPHALTHAPSTPMRSSDSQGDLVPSARNV